MTRSGIFQPADVAVLLDRDKGGATLSIPLRADTEQTGKPAPANSSGKPEKQSALHVMSWDDPTVLGMFRSLGPQLASAAGGPPLTIRLVSSTGELKNQVRIPTGEVVVGSRDRVIYTPPFAPKDAQGVGAALIAADVFRDTGAFAILSRAATGNELLLVPTRAGWPPSITAQSMQGLAQTLVPLAGAPVTVRVSDGSGQVLFAVSSE
jgi:hypothetical protein